MDARRFDRLVRAVGQAGTRRAVLSVLGGSAVGASLGLGLGLGTEEAQAGIPIVNCKIPGQKCSKDQKCCTGRCTGKKRCACQRKGKPCWSPLEGALCCSGRCAQGKCG
jgi:hypothetical protein